MKIFDISNSTLATVAALPNCENLCMVKMNLVLIKVKHAVA
jgi:hypothetical protein